MLKACLAAPADSLHLTMRNRRNDSNLADTIVKAITPRSLAPLMRNFYQRPIFGHTTQNFIQSDDRLGRPDPIFLQRHELNKAHDYALFPGEHAKRNNLNIGKAP